MIILKDNFYYLFSLFKIPTLIKHGKVSLKVNEEDFFSLEFKERTLNLKLKSLEPLKLIRKLLKIPTEEKGTLSKLSKIKELAEKLKSERYTILITWKEEPILVIGERARPILTRVILGDSIEIKDLSALLSLLSQLK